MKTRKPIQAKSTGRLLRSIFPPDFKIVKDPTSNGYKLVNLLYGVEVDEARTRLRETYSNSFIETMDLSDESVTYEVLLSGIPNSQYLNSTVQGGIPIKVVNWHQGGEAEFFDGSPTRLISNGTFTLSGVVESGNVVGVEYLRSNPSGYGYFLVSTDLDQKNYLSYDGSLWRFNLDNDGNVLSYTGSWPGVATQTFEEQGFDDILTPPSSGWLKSKYPLTRWVLDNSGVYWNIDHYEPYHGWVIDHDGHVVANDDYVGDYYYDSTGTKIWYRTAFNNPYGSGNFTTVYVSLRNAPISGTLRLYDMDVLDSSGNATEILKTGTNMYYLQSSNMQQGQTTTGVWDPTYLGYDETVPKDRGFGSIAGSTATLYTTTSWDYQSAGGAVDEGTMQYVETSGEPTNILKIVNPQSRYIAEYNYKLYKQAKYVTSLEASRYLSLDTTDPIYSLKTVLNNEIPLDYEFTRDSRYENPNFEHYGQKTRYITFDGWTVRPKSKISKIDFNIPLLFSEGSLDSFDSYHVRETSIGYPLGEVPVFTSKKVYYLDCPFDVQVALGTVTEGDWSGSGNFLDWYNTGSNEIFRIPFDSQYGKKIKYENASGYYGLNDVAFMKDRTYFRFRFRAQEPQTVTLMDIKDTTYSGYLGVSVERDGTIAVQSNGTAFYTLDKITFDNNVNDIILKYYKDDEFTTDPLCDIYLKDSFSFRKLPATKHVVSAVPINATYLKLFINCSVDVDRFQIWYEG